MEISILVVKGVKLEAGTVDAIETVAVAVAVVDTEVETEWSVIKNLYIFVRVEI